MTDDSVIRAFLDMLDIEHVDASSLDGQEMHVADTPCQSDMPIAKDIYVDACSIELARSTSIASTFYGLKYEMMISRLDIAVAVGALAVSVINWLGPLFVCCIDPSMFCLFQGTLEDHESLVAAIKQVDVVISAIGSNTLDHLKIIEAIKQVGTIKQFFPSEFGNDVDCVHALEMQRRIFLG
ncbi:hypothetical protein L7F22_012380 [Adiantum nelumboides]|nr:hypothetical protein [Adiantum nelumboides]